jgi:hypothetical protein
LSRVNRQTLGCCSWGAQAKEAVNKRMIAICHWPVAPGRRSRGAGFFQNVILMPF